jgi:hypothetical protein
MKLCRMSPKMVSYFLSSYSPILLLSYSPILLFSYSPTLLFSYSPILIFPYSHIPIFLYSHIPLFPYSHIPLFPYSGVLLPIVRGDLHHPQHTLHDQGGHRGYRCSILLYFYNSVLLCYNALPNVYSYSHIPTFPYSPIPLFPGDDYAVRAQVPLQQHAHQEEDEGIYPTTAAGL